VDPGVFRRTAGPSGFPFVPWRRSWPFARPRGPLLRDRPRLAFGVRPPTASRVHPPVGLVAPPALSVRGIHFPARPSCTRSHGDPPAPPRRGLPHPLRSASAVFHDLDGLLLLGPWNLFQLHTPMGFGLPAPLASALPPAARRPLLPGCRRSGCTQMNTSCPARGVGTRARGSRLASRPDRFPGPSPGRPVAEASVRPGYATAFAARARCRRAPSKKEKVRLRLSAASAAPALAACPPRWTVVMAASPFRNPCGPGQAVQVVARLDPMARLVVGVASLARRRSSGRVLPRPPNGPTETGSAPRPEPKLRVINDPFALPT
jgi:hypothetical protein